RSCLHVLFFSHHPATPATHTLSLHDALPISWFGKLPLAGQSLGWLVPVAITLALVVLLDRVRGLRQSATACPVLETNKGCPYGGLFFVGQDNRRPGYNRQQSYKELACSTAIRTCRMFWPHSGSSFAGAAMPATPR